MNYDLTETMDSVVEIDGDQDLHLTAMFAMFPGPVRIANSVIRKLDLHGAFFPGGLEIENCKVLCKAFLMWGGHNQRPVVITDTEFCEFVDFEDCLFEADVSLSRVRFHNGTNLLGNLGTPIEVGFDVPLRLSEVEGKLNVDTYKTTDH